MKTYLFNIDLVVNAYADDDTDPEDLRQRVELWLADFLERNLNITDPAPTVVLYQGGTLKAEASS